MLFFTFVCVSDNIHNMHSHNHHPREVGITSRLQVRNLRHMLNELPCQVLDKAQIGAWTILTLSLVFFQLQCIAWWLVILMQVIDK